MYLIIDRTVIIRRFLWYVVCISECILFGIMIRKYITIKYRGKMAYVRNSINGVLVAQNIGKNENIVSSLMLEGQVCKSQRKIE